MEFGDATLSLTLTNRIIQLNGGKPPLTYSHFIEIVSDMPPPPVPVPALHARMLGKSSSPISEDHDEKYGVPTLTELGKIRQECLMQNSCQVRYNLARMLCPVTRQQIEVGFEATKSTDLY